MATDLSLAPVETVRVLLVDDRADNLLALEAVLEPLGYELRMANSGSEALHYLLEDDIAVMILDVQMPDMDGFETASLAKSRAATRDIPIIFLTAIDFDFEYQLQGYNAGAVDFICKPFDPHVLRAKVRAIVSLSQDMRRLVAKLNEPQQAGLIADDARVPGNFVALKRVLEIDLTGGLFGPALAREAVQTLSVEQGLPRLDDLLLMISELVTNCVLHAHSPAHLIIDLGRTVLRCEVSDMSRLPPDPKYFEASLSGRGLAIVQHLSDRCGWTDKDNGKVVWFELELTDATG